MTTLKQISNQELISRIVGLATRARECQVEMLRYLSEIDERKLVVDLGYSGMWDFCRRALKFSESTSTRRINVARAARQYPELLEMLGDGRLTLCTAADLVAMLTAENRAVMLAAAAGKSRREVQSLGVAANAKAAERDVIRRVPAPARTGFFDAATVWRRPVTESQRQGSAEFKIDVAAAIVPAADQPVMHRVAFTAADDVVRKLERLQELLGGASLAEVCDRAAELLLEKVDPVRRAARREVKRTKAGDAVARSAKAAVPAAKAASEPRRPKVAMADRVLVEAGMRCSYVSPIGVRCTESRFLSVDHVRPYALDGKSTDQENLRCLCVAHNLAAGRKTFGNVHGERRSKPDSHAGRAGGLTVFSEI